MPTVDLVDETFIAIDRQSVAAIVADSSRWQQWWPGLVLTIFMDRGLDGIRWSVTGDLVGSCEIWLEACLDGVLVHYYLRADPTVPGSNTSPRNLPDSPRGWRTADALRRRQALAWKVHAWALKDELEAGRQPGEPVRDAGPR